MSLRLQKTPHIQQLKDDSKLLLMIIPWDHHPMVGGSYGTKRRRKGNRDTHRRKKTWERNYRLLQKIEKEVSPLAQMETYHDNN